MPKSREIRSLRHISKGDDGDTTQLSDFQMLRNGKRFHSWTPLKSLSKDCLKVRLLGIDKPELPYPSPIDKSSVI